MIVEANNELTPDDYSVSDGCRVPEISVFFPERDDIGIVLSQTIKKDTIKTSEEL